MNIKKNEDLFANNAKLGALVEKIMKHPRSIRRYDDSLYDANDIAAILSILQRKADSAMEQHPGENLEKVLGKDVFDQYNTFRELANMREITVPVESIPE